MVYFLFFGLLLNSCNFIKENLEVDYAIEYNDKVMLQNDILTVLFEKTNADNLSADESKLLNQNFLNACDNAVDTLSKMKPFMKDNSLRDGMINYIKNFKLLIEQDGQKIDSIIYGNEELTERQNDQLTQLGEELNEKLDEEYQKFNQIHSSFAKRHHYMIEN